MPPKRARAVEQDAEETDQNDCPTSAERKERAEARKREALQNRLAAAKAGAAESQNKVAVPSPARKKIKGKMEEKKFANQILQQVAYNNIVDSGFVPTGDDSLRLDDDSMTQSFNSLSPGLLGNLSIRSKESPDGAEQKLHDEGGKEEGGSLGMLDNMLGSAVQFLRTAYRGKAKVPSDNLNAPYKRNRTVFGNDGLANVLSKQSDLSLLERTYSAAELVLLSSPIYTLDAIYAKALAAIYKTHRDNEQQGINESMTINQCLAWLARAAHCPVKALIPKGEYYPDAEDYLRIRLIVPKLLPFNAVCAGMNETEWGVNQVLRCMKMMAVVDLSTLAVDDRCILLYAIGMLYIDDVASEEMRESAHSLVRNVLNSCSDRSLLLEPLFNLTAVIVRRPDEGHKWLLMFTACGIAPPDLLLSIAAAHFIQLCERAECTPEQFHYPSLAQTCTAYVNVLAETGVEVFNVYHSMHHRRFHDSLVSVLNCALTVTALRVCEKKSKQALVKCLEAVRNRLNPDAADDSIIITQLRALARRLEKQPSVKGGRRNSEQIIQIKRDKAKIREEKGEQLRDEKREKAILKRQREETQRNVARRLAMEAEKEKEEEGEKEDGKEEEMEKEKKRNKKKEAERIPSIEEEVEVDEKKEEKEGKAAAAAADADSMEEDEADLAETVEMN